MNSTFSLTFERIAMKRAQAGGIVLALMLGCTAGVLAAAPPPDSVASEAAADNATVEIDGDVLFRVRGTAAYPADVRARSIQNRIEAAAADPTVHSEDLRLVNEDTAVAIVAGDSLLMAVHEADAKLEQLSISELAGANKKRIGQAIEDFRRARGPDAMRKAALSTGIATLLFAIVVVLVFRGSRWFDGWLHRRILSRIQTVGIQSFEIVRAEKIQSGLRAFVHVVRTLLLLAVLFVYLDFTLAQFPWTQALSRHLLDLVTDPLAKIARGVIAQIPNLVFLLILIYVFRLILRLVRLFFQSIGNGTIQLAEFDSEWAVPTYKIVRFAIIVFGLIIAYPYIPGSHSDAFKGVSLFVGILFSLGSSSAIANIIAGYMMTYRRAFKVGDRVKIGDAIGDVIQTRLQVTHLRTLKNEEVVLPNSQILGNQVMNYSSLARKHGLILHIEAGIGYETPWRQVEAMLLMAAERTPGLLKEPPPFILYKGLGDFAVNYELNVYCDNAQAMNPLYAALSRNILDVFNEYGVQIMTPNYEGDPEQVKIVAKKDWFLAPAKSLDAAGSRHTASDE
jgi:small-conductance mechanosensitive channel